jgi:threonine dehydrogenase-like Zn-dependent dehydrogenase
VQATFPRVNIVQLKGNVEEDSAAISRFGPVDAYIDLSPPYASKSTHVRSCLMALKQYGRANLMGMISDDIAIPYATAVFMNLTIRAQYMYEREDVRGLIKLAESGVLKLGKDGGQEVVGQFGLEEIHKAFEAATANRGVGKMAVLTP